jgi:hypothetical protein
MDNEDSPRKRGKYNTKKSQKIETLLEAAKEFKSNKVEAPTKRRYTISELTDNVCIYPNRYLDNDDSCVACDLYEFCGCTAKNLGKKKR